MITEITGVRQINGDPRRRWFSNEDFDLIVWLDDPDDHISGFQLCYDKTAYQRALTWHSEHGYLHNRVDDGENTPGKYKAAPILVCDGIFEKEIIAAQFA